MGLNCYFAKIGSKENLVELNQETNMEKVIGIVKLYSFFVECLCRMGLNCYFAKIGSKENLVELNQEINMEKVIGIVKLYSFDVGI